MNARQSCLKVCAAINFRSVSHQIRQSFPFLCINPKRYTEVLDSKLPNSAINGDKGAGDIGDLNCPTSIWTNHPIHNTIHDTGNIAAPLIKRN